MAPMHSTQTHSLMASPEEAQSECIMARQKAAVPGSATAREAAGVGSMHRTRAPPSGAPARRRFSITCTACRTRCIRRPRGHPASTLRPSGAMRERQSVRGRPSVSCASSPHTRGGAGGSGHGSRAPAVRARRACRRVRVEAVLVTWHAPRAAAKRLRPSHLVEVHLLRARRPTATRPRAAHGLPSLPTPLRKGLHLHADHFSPRPRELPPTTEPKRGHQGGSGTVSGIA